MAIHNNSNEPPITIWIDNPQKITQLETELPRYATGKWKHISRLQFEYDGFAMVYIPYDENSWRKNYIQFGNFLTVKPLKKEVFTGEEIGIVLDKFLKDLLIPYCKNHPDLKVTREGIEL